ncbi:MAG: hypothetical protein ISS16_11660 [Ignavibacteria bacterium]|nr:hypothetical protein [Ignavibacteria bacterium]
MYLSPLQEEIIKKISEGKIKNLYTFYLAYFGKFETVNTALDTCGYGKKYIPKAPIILGIVSQGIFFDQSRKDLVSNFILTWKLLEENGLIKSYACNEIEFESRKDLYLPLKESYHYKYEYDFEIWNLIKEYFIKDFLVTEELKIFVKKKFKTVKERKDTKRFIFTWISIAIAVLSILASIIFL